MAEHQARIVILGGRGMLGTDLASACRRQGLEPLVLDLPRIHVWKSLKRLVMIALLVWSDNTE